MMTNDGHSLNDEIPAEIAENLNEWISEYGEELNYEEVVQYQRSVYQSLQENDSTKEIRSDRGQSSNSSQFSGQERESSRRASFDSQLALDEALARSLQELEDKFDDFDLSESAGIDTENREGSSSSRGSPAVNVREDDIDPDNMTYEQLRSLGESVGSENKGLSADLISRLPSFKYKTGILSKKKKTDECAICLVAVKNGDNLSILPCAHQYHSKCITPWLKDHKTCPVCKKEVTED